MSQKASTQIYQNVSLTLQRCKPAEQDKVSSSEAPMSETNDPKQPMTSKLMHYGMLICCTVMLLPVAGYFLTGGTISGLWNNLAVFAPIALCIGAHVLMFVVMGKSCHSAPKKTAQDNQVDAAFEDAAYDRAVDARVSVQEPAR
jgi:hypothetical protein